MNLVNYLFGTEIIDFYAQIKRKHPEKTQKLNWEKNKHIFFGKVIPNALDLGGIVLTASNHEIYGISSITLGEYARYYARRVFLDNKMYHLCND